MMCELATSQLEALHLGVHAQHPTEQPHQLMAKGLAQTPGVQTALSRPSLSAHQALSQPYPHDSVDMAQLSTNLSTISAASDLMQCARKQHRLVEEEHSVAIEALQELMVQTAKGHARLFNEALETACRYVHESVNASLVSGQQLDSSCLTVLDGNEIRNAFAVHPLFVVHVCPACACETMCYFALTQGMQAVVQ